MVFQFDLTLEHGDRRVARGVHIDAERCSQICHSLVRSNQNESFDLTRNPHRRHAVLKLRRIWSQAASIPPVPESQVWRRTES